MIRHERRLASLVPILSLLLSATPVWGGGGPASGMPGLFPPENRLTPWRLAEGTDTYTVGTLYDYIDGGAEIYLEYGFEKVETGYLAHESDTCLVDVYSMKTTAGAFGLFSHTRDPEGEGLLLGDGGSLSDYQLSFWLGNRVYMIQPVTGAVSREEMTELAEILLRWGRHVSALAQLAEVLPAGVADENLVLLLGPLAMRNHFPLVPAETIGVSVKRPGLLVSGGQMEGENRLLLVRFESRGEAAAALARVARYLGWKEAGSPPASVSDPWIRQQGEDAWTGVVLAGEIVAVAEGRKETGITDLLRNLSLRP